MVISLSADIGKPLTVKPDPAFVRIGENVVWELYVAPGAGFDSVGWVIYFSDANPFGKTRGAWRQLTEATRSGEHKGMLDAGPAKEPGDYKYGVRIVNAKTNVELSDDDPRLIVIR